MFKKIIAIKSELLMSRDHRESSPNGYIYITVFAYGLGTMAKKEGGKIIVRARILGSLL